MQLRLGNRLGVSLVLRLYTCTWSVMVGPAHRSAIAGVPCQIRAENHRLYVIDYCGPRIFFAIPKLGAAHLAYP
jgi:hypothetical protein